MIHVVDALREHPHRDIQVIMGAKVRMVLNELPGCSLLILGDPGVSTSGPLMAHGEAECMQSIKRASGKSASLEIDGPNHCEKTGLVGAGVGEHSDDC